MEPNEVQSSGSVISKTADDELSSHDHPGAWVAGNCSHIWDVRHFVLRKKWSAPGKHFSSSTVSPDEALPGAAGVQCWPHHKVPAAHHVRQCMMEKTSDPKHMWKGQE